MSMDMSEMRRKAIELSGFEPPANYVPNARLRQAVMDQINNDRNFRLNEAQLTERYVPKEAEDTIRKMAELKRSYGTADPLGQKNIANQSNALREDWRIKGLDPSVIESGISVDEMLNRFRGMGKTAQGQQRQFGNKLNLDQFDRSKFESDRNYNRGVFENNRSYGLQASNASRAQNNADIGMKFDIWKLTGRAPEGIPGVAAGTSIYEEPKISTPDPMKASDYKTNPSFASDAQRVLSNPTAYRQALIENAEEFISEYGMDGYNALLKLAEGE